MILFFKNIIWFFKYCGNLYPVIFFNLPPVFCCKSSQQISTKCQRVNIFGFVSPMVSVAVTQICHYTVKAATVYVNELASCIPIKLYL